jgi:hypothetical protein
MLFGAGKAGRNPLIGRKFVKLPDCARPDQSFSQLREGEPGNDTVRATDIPSSAADTQKQCLSQWRAQPNMPET